MSDFTQDPDIAGILTTSFNQFVEELLDDPAWILGEAQTFIPKVRKTAAWLGIDFDALLDNHYNKYEVERLRALEQGRPIP